MPTTGLASNQQTNLRCHGIVRTPLVAVLRLGHQHWLTIHHYRLVQVLHTLEPLHPPFHSSSLVYPAAAAIPRRSGAQITQLSGQNTPSGGQKFHQGRRIRHDRPAFGVRDFSLRDRNYSGVGAWLVAAAEAEPEGRPIQGVRAEAKMAGMDAGGDGEHQAWPKLVWDTGIDKSHLGDTWPERNATRIDMNMLHKYK